MPEFRQFSKGNSSNASTLQIAASTERPQKILYSRKDAAYCLSISVRSLDYLIANRQLATRRLGKKVMISHGELSRFSRADHFDLSIVRLGENGSRGSVEVAA